MTATGGSELTDTEFSDELESTFTDDDELIIFFAHPDDRNLTLPLEYEGAMNSSSSTHRATISAFGYRYEIVLSFDPNASVLLHVGPGGVKQTRCVLGRSEP